MTSVLAINGSYRQNGITDQAVNAMADTLRAKGVAVDVVVLRDYPIEFCANCRECTQQPGEAPGHCVLQDGMSDLVDKIEQADAYILAAPTNFGSVTALFKRFMERLIAYAYWPWGAAAPVYRKRHQKQKKAVLISSSAAPGVMARLFFNSGKQLKATAKTIGARAVGVEFCGLVSGTPHKELSTATKHRIQRLAAKLV